MSVSTSLQRTEPCPTRRRPAPPERPAARPPTLRIATQPRPQRDGVATREREWVRSILAGRRDAFRQLYEAYSPRVYRFARQRLRDEAEAEDVTQEVFETVFFQLGNFRGDSSLLVWIFGITRNKVNRRFRGWHGRFHSIEEGGVAEPVVGLAETERAAEAHQLLARCREVVEGGLSPLQRRIFHLKHLRGQRIRHIADALGKSEDAIKANLYRMRRALARGTQGLESFLDS